MCIGAEKAIGVVFLNADTTATCGKRKKAILLSTERRVYEFLTPSEELRGLV